MAASGDEDSQPATPDEAEDEDFDPEAEDAFDTAQPDGASPHESRIDAAGAELPDLPEVCQCPRAVSSKAAFKDGVAVPGRWACAGDIGLLCARCRFRAMDPFRPVWEDKDVLRIMRVSAAKSSFTLEIPELRQWRKMGFAVEVRMLRSCAVELHMARKQKETDHLKQAWPRFFSVAVNGHMAFVIKPPARGRKRRDVPKDISAALRRGTNQLEVFADDLSRDEFVFAVVRSNPRLPRDVARHVLRSSQDDCLSRVRTLLTARVDAVESVGDDRLLLRCPISLHRPVSVPVRGETCRHLQCIDLDTYLITNFRTQAFNSRWRCPICSLQLRPQDLCIDSYMESILANTGPSVDEALLAQDGSWRAVEEEAPGQESDSDDELPPALRKAFAAAAAQPPRTAVARVAKAAGAPVNGIRPATLASSATGVAGNSQAASPARAMATSPQKRLFSETGIGGSPIAAGGNILRLRKPVKTPPKASVPKYPALAALSRFAPKATAPKTVVRKRVIRKPPPPKHAIAVDSDAEPEDVTDEETRAAAEQHEHAVSGSQSASVDACTTAATPCRAAHQEHQATPSNSSGAPDQLTERLLQCLGEAASEEPGSKLGEIGLNSTGATEPAECSANEGDGANSTVAQMQALRVAQGRSMPLLE